MPFFMANFIHTNKNILFFCFLIDEVNFFNDQIQVSEKIDCCLYKIPINYMYRANSTRYN